MCCHSSLNIKEEDPAKNRFLSIDVNIAIKESTRIFLYHSAVDKRI